MMSMMLLTAANRFIGEYFLRAYNVCLALPSKTEFQFQSNVNWCGKNMVVVWSLLHWNFNAVTGHHSSGVRVEPLTPATRHHSSGVRVEPLTPAASNKTLFGKSVIKFGEWSIWRHWRQWRQWVAPMDAPLSPMAIRWVAPFKWRHLIHSMAIQSPFRVSGSFGDPMAPIDPVAQLTPMATMAIHLIQWHQLRQWRQ